MVAVGAVATAVLPLGAFPGDLDQAAAASRSRDKAAVDFGGVLRPCSCLKTRAGSQMLYFSCVCNLTIYGTRGSVDYPNNH